MSTAVSLSVKRIFHFSPLFSPSLVYTGFIIISFSLPQKLLFCSTNANSPLKISAGCVAKSKRMKSHGIKESTEILLENLESISLLPPPSSQFPCFVLFFLRLNHCSDRFHHTLCRCETFFILVNEAESKDCLVNRRLNRLQFVSPLP